MGTYEQLFFNNSKGMQAVSKDKNQQIVDLRGYGYTPEKQATTKLNDQYFASGKKSMVGHSDFLPVGEQSQVMNLPPKPEQSVMLASEHSTYKPLPEQSSYKPVPTQQRQVYPRAEPNYDFKMSAAAGERTDTMDFIDKMLNQGEKDNQNYQKMFNGDDFKIPEYEGFQQSILKKPRQEEVIVGHNFENYTNRLKESQHEPSIGNRSLFGGNTLGSMNLEALNQRQNDRLAKIEQQQFDFESAIKKSEQRQENQAPMSEELQNLDNLLFDILKS